MSKAELSEAENWKIGFALYPGPHSPMESVKFRGALVEVGRTALQYGLSVDEAALYLSEDSATLSDPRLQESLRQSETGEGLVEITPEDLTRR